MTRWHLKYDIRSAKYDLVFFIFLRSYSSSTLQVYQNYSFFSKPFHAIPLVAVYCQEKIVVLLAKLSSTIWARPNCFQLKLFLTWLLSKKHFFIKNDNRNQYQQIRTYLNYIHFFFKIKNRQKKVNQGIGIHQNSHRRRVHSF